MQVELDEIYERNLKDLLTELELMIYGLKAMITEFPPSENQFNRIFTTLLLAKSKCE